MSFENNIRAALAGGTPYELGIDDFLSEPASVVSGVRQGRILFSRPIELERLTGLAALLPADLAVANWCPSHPALQALHDAPRLVRLDGITFTIEEAGRRLMSVALVVSLASPKGISLELLDKPFPIAIALQRVFVRLDFLASGKRLVFVELLGRIAIGTLKLETTVSLPRLHVAASLEIGDQPTLAALLEGFDVAPFQSASDIIVHGLGLQFDLVERRIRLRAGLATPDGQEIAIANGANGFAISELSLALGADRNGVAVELAAAFIIAGQKQETLKLGAMFSYESASGLWLVEAGLKAPISVGELIRHFLGLPLPEDLSGFLKNIKLEEADCRAMITKDQNKGVTLQQVQFGFRVAAAWKIFGKEFNSDTSFFLVRDARNRTNSGFLVADLAIDGFKITLTYQFQKDEKKLLLQCGAFGGLLGSFTLGDGGSTVRLKFLASRTLKELIAEAASIFTGADDATLPEPWSSLADFEVPLNALKLDIDLATDTVSLDFDHPMTFLPGVSVTGATLSYGPRKGKPTERRGLAFRVKGNFKALGLDQEPSWDPSRPQDAPAIAGFAQKRFSVELAAIGHGMKPLDGKSVPEAMTALVALLKEADPAKKFSTDGGWLVAGRFTILEAVDTQLLYSEAGIAGISVAIDADGARKIKSLAPLAGLRAEILYRRLGPNLGVYQGTLEMPEALRHTRFMQFEAQFPRFIVAYYTNGDYMIDVGFPHDGDFAQSLSMRVGHYIGAVGLYFAHLSGETSGHLLPAYDATAGRFGSLTAFGLGLRLGIVERYDSGPLTATLSLVLEAILEGIFSTYSAFKTGESDDYFKISASARLTGRLEGKVDFVLIKVDVLVEITVKARIEAEAHKPILIPFDASLLVKASLIVDLVLTSIHYEFEFSAAIHAEFTLGEASRPLWAVDAPPVRALSGASEQQRMPFEFRAPSFRTEFTVYIVPQLTRGMSDAGLAQWAYCLQLALAAPQNRADLAAKARWQTFAKLSTVWVLDAAAGGRPGFTSLDEAAAALSLSAELVGRLLERLRAPEDCGMSYQAIRNFLHGCSFVLDRLPKATSPSPFLSFFPMPPGFAIRQTDAGEARRNRDAEDLCREQLLRDYIVLTVRSVLGEVAAAFKAGTLAGTCSLEQAFGTIPLASAAAAATRFMLHGGRLDGRPLYAATGQQVLIDSGAERIDLTVSAGAWGTSRLSVAPPAAPLVQLRGAADSITLSSTTDDLFAPQKIRDFVILPSRTIDVRRLDSGLSIQPEYPLRRSLSCGAASVFAFSRSLSAALRRNPAATVAYSFAEGGNVAGARAVTTISLDLTRMPDRLPPGRFKDQMYRIDSVPAADLERLAALLAVRMADAELHIWLPTPQGTSRRVEKGDFGITRTSLATEYLPPAASPARVAGATVDTVKALLSGLLLAGVTGGGGVHIYLLEGTALQFDARGRARATVVISHPSLPVGTLTAVQVMPPPTESTLFAALPDVAPMRADEPGRMAVMARLAAVENGAERYQSSLDHLFNLIQFVPLAFIGPAGEETVIEPQKAPTATGPTGTADGGAYNQEFDLVALCPGQSGNELDFERSPYRRIGQALKVRPYWVDLFGNRLPAGAQEDKHDRSLTIGYSDPLLGFGDWPQLGTSFVIEPGSAGGSRRVLKLRLVWTPPAQLAQGDIQAFAEIGRRFKRVYYQLDDLVRRRVWEKPALAPVITLSFAPAPVTVGAAALSSLRDFAQDICLSCNLILTGLRGLSGPAETFATGSGRRLMTLEFPLPEGPTSYNPALVLPLIVEFLLKRDPRLLDSGVSNVDQPRILAVTSRLSPQHDDAPAAMLTNEGTPTHIRRFATRFEEAFTDVGWRLLAGDAGTGETGQLWLIHWEQGGICPSRFTYDDGAAFAPEPLSKGQRVVSMSGRSSHPDDLEASVDTFVDHLARLNQPDLLLVNCVLQQRLGRACRDATRALASWFRSRLWPLAGEDANPDLQAVGTAFERLCLADPRNWYETAAVIAIKPQAGLAAGTINAARQQYRALTLLGRPVYTDTELKACAGRVDLLDPAAALCLPLQPVARGRRSGHAWPVAFVIDQIEINARAIAIDLADSGSALKEEVALGHRLSFLTAGGRQVKIEPLVTGRPARPIALPLRTMPDMPVLSAARAEAAALPGGGDAAGVIHTARSWQMRFSARYGVSAGDTLHVRVLPQRPARAANGDGLATRLDLFNRDAPAKLALFEKYLSKPDSVDADTMRRELASMVQGIDAIAELVAKERDHARPSLATEKAVAFSIRENHGDDDSASFAITVKPVGKAVDGLSVRVEVDGLSTSARATADGGWTLALADRFGRPITVKEAAALHDRTLVIGSFDIGDWPQAHVEMRILRNEGLPAPFHLSGRSVSGNRPVVPLVEQRQTISLGRARDRVGLESVLRETFKGLLARPTGSGGTAAFSVFGRLRVGTTPPGGVGLQSELPLFARLDVRAPDVAADIASFVFSRDKPSVAALAGHGVTLILEITMTDIGGKGLAALHLENVAIAIG